MADYGKLFCRIWANEDFRKLSARDQQLYCLLISFPTRNLAGVLPLTIKRWSHCTADSSEKKIADSLNALNDARFIVLDTETEEVLVRTFIRNDEVYKQPNLLKAALKDAKRTESMTLRLVIRQELLALPEHRNQDLTAAAAYNLVETPSEPFLNPSGRVSEMVLSPQETPNVPLIEPCGVGGYLSSKDAPPPTPPPTPPPRARERTSMDISTITNGHPAKPLTPAPVELQKSEAATKGGILVRECLKIHWPDAVLTDLRLQANALMKEGVDPAAIRICLRNYETEPAGGRRLLRHFLADAIRELNGHNGHKPGPAVTKGADWQAMKTGELS
jgi:hypothetical protein